MRRPRPTSRPIFRARIAAYGLMGAIVAFATSLIFVPAGQCEGVDPSRLHEGLARYLEMYEPRLDELTVGVEIEGRIERGDLRSLANACAARTPFSERMLQLFFTAENAVLADYSYWVGAQGKRPERNLYDGWAFKPIGQQLGSKHSIG